MSDLEKKQIINGYTEAFWDEIQPKIEDIIEKIKKNLKEQEAKNYLDSSYSILNGITSTLTEEQFLSYTHTEIIRYLQDIFILLIASFIIENGIETNLDAIDILCDSTYNYLNYLKYQNSPNPQITINSPEESLFKRPLSNPDFNSLKQITRELQNNGEFIPQGYSKITQTIKFINNLERHTQPFDKPIDWILGEKSFGNLYTITSLFILSTYAYLEIINTWLTLFP